MVLHSTKEPFFVVLVPRDASDGGAPPLPPLSGPQPVPSHRFPGAKFQLQWHL